MKKFVIGITSALVIVGLFSAGNAPAAMASTSTCNNGYPHLSYTAARSALLGSNGDNEIQQELTFWQASTYKWGAWVRVNCSTGCQFAQFLDSAGRVLSGDWFWITESRKANNPPPDINDWLYTKHPYCP
jgi:hypothetical protein